MFSCVSKDCDKRKAIRTSMASHSRYGPLIFVLFSPLVTACYILFIKSSFFTIIRLLVQDFLGQMFCTLGEIVGSPASRLEKPLG